ncbi:pseudouridine synthase [uncultured Umboniibacter sp.]|uniref:pseudouridine synthase n=1 Tax=uncultured Umboniibacter sp. TaxID=1798917 RepID=UPI0026094274|nr:pseudouridine synthase [uncultured Umboniibacter sp.]
MKTKLNIRLDRWVGQHSPLSRSDVKFAVKAKRIKVNGKLAVSASQKISQEDVVSLDGAEIVVRGFSYIMLNKPLGVICATRDGCHQTVVDLLPTHFQQLHPVGRLDKDTTGLVLLSDDGQWSHRVTHPKYACEKCYKVTAKWPISAATIERLLHGVVLRDSPKPACATAVEQLGENQLMMTISEGRYHQVRRMIAACENRVTDLHRLSVGSLQLDIAEGEWRELTVAEIVALA